MAQQIPKFDVEGESSKKRKKKKKYIKPWTCFLVYMIKPLMFSNVLIGYPSKKKLDLFYGLC
jgi:hypothetical protein